MPVAVADGEHPEPAEDEEPVVEMEIGDASLPIDVDTGGDGQVEEVDGSEDTNGASSGKRTRIFLLVGRILCRSLTTMG
jgi:hypothetical protein